MQGAGRTIGALGKSEDTAGNLAVLSDLFQDFLQGNAIRRLGQFISAANSSKRADQFPGS
jgi:hypothetical protein